MGNEFSQLLPHLVGLFFVMIVAPLSGAMLGSLYREFRDSRKPKHQS